MSFGRRKDGRAPAADKSRGGIALIALLLAGCEGREIAACEDYVKYGLRSPSTYGRVNVTTRDEPVTGPRIAELGGREPRGGQSLALRTVTIEYDAQNAFGTPIRSAAQCGFVLRDGEIAGQQLLNSSVRLAQAKRDTRMLQREPDPLYPCCL